jgi:hypothetical protein
MRLILCGASVLYASIVVPNTLRLRSQARSRAQPPGHLVRVAIQPSTRQDRRGQLARAGEPGGLAHAAKLAQKVRISRRAIARFTRSRSRITSSKTRLVTPLLARKARNSLTWVFTRRGGRICALRSASKCSADEGRQQMMAAVRAMKASWISWRIARRMRRRPNQCSRRSPVRLSTGASLHLLQVAAPGADLAGRSADGLRLLGTRSGNSARPGTEQLVELPDHGVVLVGGEEYGHAVRPAAPD